MNIQVTQNQPAMKNLLLFYCILIPSLFGVLTAQNTVFQLDTPSDINPLMIATEPNNRVGLLTSNPITTFHVFNTAQLSNPDGILYLGNPAENYIKFDFDRIQSNLTLLLQEEGGNINLGNHTLFVDQQNGFVGINKTNIDTELDILGEMEMSTSGIGTAQKDKIAIFGTLEDNAMLGFGFETNIIPALAPGFYKSLNLKELYFKSQAGYNWYINTNAGVAPKMVLDQQGDLGIGQDAPGAKLHISETGASHLIRADQSGNPRFMVENNGQVGIKVLDPLADLHVLGSASIAQFLLAPDFHPSGGDAEILLGEDNDFNFGMAIHYDGLENKLKIFGNDDGPVGPHLTIERNSGQTAIGYAGDVPGGYMLAVDGEILSEGLVCELSGNWADHVFIPGYRLKPLEEVDAFIKRHGHLPGFPSSDSLKKTGLDFEDIVTLQQEKIEELTLYLIEMKKELDALKKKVR